MANGRVCDGTRIGVRTQDASFCSEISKMVRSRDADSLDGLRIPSVTGSVSHGQSEDSSHLLDPVVAMNAMITCGATASEAAGVLQSYYHARAGVSTPSVSNNSSQNSTKSGYLRVKRWAERIAALTEQLGFCYLHIVKYSRRPYYAETLKMCPSIQDFIALLEYADLDINAASTYGVFLLPDFDNPAITRYHIAETCDDGVRIGSALGVISCVLRTHPLLNTRDLHLPMDHSVQSFTWVGGVMGYNGEINLDALRIPRVNVRGLIRSAATVDVHGDADCFDDAMVFDRPGHTIGLTEVHVSFDVRVCQVGDVIPLGEPVDGVTLWFFSPNSIDVVDPKNIMRKISSGVPQVIVQKQGRHLAEHHVRVTQRTACFVLRFKCSTIHPYALLDELRDTGWLHTAIIEKHIDDSQHSTLNDMKLCDSADRYGFMQLFHVLGESLGVTPIDAVTINAPIEVPDVAIIRARKLAYGVRLSMRDALGKLEAVPSPMESQLSRRLRNVIEPQYKTYPLRGVDGFAFRDVEMSSFVAVSVNRYQAGEKIVLPRSEIGSDTSMFPLQSVRDLQTTNNSGMSSLPNCDPCIFLRSSRFGGETLYLEVLRDTCSVTLHYEAGHGVSAVADQLRHAGLLALTALDADFAILYHTDGERLAHKPSQKPRGLGALLTEVAVLSQVPIQFYPDIQDVLDD